MPLYFFSLIFFIFIAPAYAIDQMYNWNGLEFVTSGNVTHVHPASPESTRLRGGWVLDISDVEPKATASHDLPYKHKGGALAKVQVRPSIDPSKVAAKARDALKTAAGAAAGGNPYLTVAALACGVFCDALIDWGLESLKLDADGSIYASVPDPAAPVSDGYQYCAGTRFNELGGCNVYFQTKYHALQHLYQSCVNDFDYLTKGDCIIKSDHVDARWGSGRRIQSYVKKTNVASTCLAGSGVSSDGYCTSAPSIETPLSDYMESNYTGKGWSHHWAKMTAAIVEAGGNVFTDGTSVDITGPSIVPLSTSETRTSVNLIPGTNTPAPVGHTGPTDPGTQTTTTTTTAKNTYTPAPFSSSSAPSMKTTQQTQTVTNIINNITNITTTENTTITESDDSPEKEQKDFCEQNPDSLACAELDTPEAEIPRDTVNITFVPENLGFGAGTCPADKQIGPHTFSYAATCDILSSYVKPLVIALALFGALLIVFVGKADA